MVRRLLKETLCRGLASAGLDGWLGRVTRSIQWPWVVGYHLVVEDDAAATQVMPGLAISGRTLELHLDWIGRRFRFVSLAELGALAERGAARGRPLAAVTFDDGYRGVYDHAFPMLKRKGIPAAVFVVTDLIGTSRLHSHDSLYLLLTQRLGRPPGEAYQATRAMLQSLQPTEVDLLARSEGRQRPDTPSLLPLTWEMLVEMQEAGFTIGSHTKTHPRGGISLRLYDLRAPRRGSLLAHASAHHAVGTVGARLRRPLLVRHPQLPGPRASGAGLGMPQEPPREARRARVN